MPIQVPYRGIVEIVGDHDVGKTIAALQTVNNMKKVVFVDDDVKGDGTVRQMKDAGMDFEMYIDLAKRRAELGQAPSPDELLTQAVMPTVEEVTSRHHDVIIWDTWRTVYQSCRGHVEHNQPRYSKVVTFRGSSPIIQGLISKVARIIEQNILNKLKEACDLLIITHHIKDNYVQNVVVGKIPESSQTFSEVCNMRLWLRRNPQSKVPIILFLKRPNVPKLSKGKLVFTNVVPLKITPTNEHESIWDAIKEYEDKPIQSRKPRPDETPTAEELAAISGTLTEEQKQYVKSMIEYQKMIGDELSEAMEEKSTETAQSKDKAPETAQDEPSNGLQLLSLAKVKFGYDLKTIEQIVGLSFKEINEDFKPEHWQKIIKHNASASSKDKKKGK